MKERFAFASLAETHHGAGSVLKVGDSHLGDLLRGGNETDPVLSRAELAALLEADAAQAAGIADGGGGQRGFPAPEEVILGSRAAETEGTLAQVLDEAIVPARFHHPMGVSPDFGRIEAIAVLAGILIDAQGRDHESAIVPSHRGVGEQGQDRGPARALVRRGVQLGVCRSDERRHPPDVSASGVGILLQYPEAGGRRIVAHGHPPGQLEQLTTRG